MELQFPERGIGLFKNLLHRGLRNSQLLHIVTLKSRGFQPDKRKFFNLRMVA
jgi:hypothetical protein